MLYVCLLRVYVCACLRVCPCVSMCVNACVCVHGRMLICLCVRTLGVRVCMHV